MDPYERRTPAGWWLGAGLLVGLFSGMLLGRKRSLQPGAGAHRISSLPAWERALAKERSPEKAALTMAWVQARYEELYPGRPRFRNPVLRWHLENRILPGLALYQVLLRECGDQETALALVDRLFRSAESESSFIRQVRQWPDPFGLVRQGSRWGLRLGYPPQGWKIDMVEDNPHRIAFNISGCLYLNVLTGYGAPELTAHFCALDDLLYDSLKGVIWERTQTLGRGDPCCNFGFRKLEG